MKSSEPTCDKISMLFVVSADALHDSTDVTRRNSVEPPGLLFRLLRSLPAQPSTGKMLRSTSHEWHQLKSDCKHHDDVT